MIKIRLLLFPGSLLLCLSFSCRINTMNDPWEKANAIIDQISIPVFQAQTYNIVDYGAKGDSTTLNTISINKAIHDCNQKGGGTVIVPPGIFLTGAIHLLSNVNLKLEKGSELRFSSNPSDYLPLVHTSWEGIECMNYSPLIYAYGKKNIAITGDGLLNGMASNAHWWPWCGSRSFGWQAGSPSQGNADARPLLDSFNLKRTPVVDRIMGEVHYLRPQFIQFNRCENILIENISLKNSPFWEIHPLMSKNITIRNVKVNSTGPNNDGCDPESCRNVLVENCNFNTGDDCIALKSGRNEDSRTNGMPIENVVIRNCNMENGHGGIVIGSEVSGGAKNIFVENCRMDSPHLDRAIRIKTNNNRGGIVDSIFIRNIEVGEVNEAVIKINCKYNPQEGSGNFPPVVSNVFISGISSSKSAYALFFEGLDNFQSIKNIYLKNCTFSGVNFPNRIENVTNLNLVNVKINKVNIRKEVLNSKINVTE